MLHLCAHGSPSFLLILKRDPTFIQEAAGTGGAQPWGDLRPRLTSQAFLCSSPTPTPSPSMRPEPSCPQSCLPPGGTITCLCLCPAGPGAQTLPVTEFHAQDVLGASVPPTALPRVFSPGSLLRALDGVLAASCRRSGRRGLPEGGALAGRGPGVGWVWGGSGVGPHPSHDPGQGCCAPHLLARTCGGRGLRPSPLVEQAPSQGQSRGHTNPTPPCALRESLGGLALRQRPSPHRWSLWGQHQGGDQELLATIC